MKKTPDEVAWKNFTRRSYMKLALTLADDLDTDYIFEIGDMEVAFMAGVEHGRKQKRKWRK